MNFENCLMMFANSADYQGLSVNADSRRNGYQLEGISSFQQMLLDMVAGDDGDEEELLTSYSVPYMINPFESQMDYEELNEMAGYPTMPGALMVQGEADRQKAPEIQPKILIGEAWNRPEVIKVGGIGVREATVLMPEGTEKGNPQDILPSISDVKPKVIEEGLGGISRFKMAPTIPAGMEKLEMEAHKATSGEGYAVENDYMDAAEGRIQQKGESSLIMTLDGSGFEIPVEQMLSAQGVSGEGKSETLNQVHEQIGAEILTRLVKKGPTEFKIQLQPEDLGQIDVKLKIHRGRLTIDISALSDKTQSLLTSQVDKLIAGLGLHNVQVENIQLNSQSQLGSREENQGYLMQSAMNFSHDERQRQWEEKGSRGFGTSIGFKQGTGFGENSPVEKATPKGFYKMNYTV
ncbi:MAG: flagellar hook-length control protein FliK [Anaerovoracaceae bacterium]